MYLIPTKISIGGWDIVKERKLFGMSKKCIPSNGMPEGSRCLFSKDCEPYVHEKYVHRGAFCRVVLLGSEFFRTLSEETCTEECIATDLANKFSTFHKANNMCGCATHSCDNKKYIALDPNATITRINRGEKTRCVQTPDLRKNKDAYRRGGALVCMSPEQQKNDNEKCWLGKFGTNDCRSNVCLPTKFDKFLPKMDSYVCRPVEGWGVGHPCFFNPKDTSQVLYEDDQNYPSQPDEDEEITESKKRGYCKAGLECLAGHCRKKLTVTGPEGEPEGESEAESEGQSEAESEGESEAASEGESEATSEGESEAEPEGESEAESEGQSEAASEGESEATSEGESEAASEGESEAESEGESEAESEGESEAESEGQSEAESEGESEAASEGESKAESEGESEAALQQTTSRRQGKISFLYPHPTPIH